MVLPSVFLDASVMKHAVNRRIVGYNVEEISRLGGLEQAVQVRRWREYFPNTEAPESLRPHLRVLSLIAHLARRKRITLLAQVEASVEFWGLPQTYDTRGMLQGAPVERAPNPINYSRVVFGGPASAPDHQRQFLEGVTHPRYLDLQKVTGANNPGPRRRNQLADAFHIWSAETAGADYFLTTDLSLVRSAEANRPEKPKVFVVPPRTLVIDLTRRRVLRFRDVLSWTLHELQTKRRGSPDHPEERLLEMSRRLDERSH